MANPAEDVFCPILLPGPVPGPVAWPVAWPFSPATRRFSHLQRTTMHVGGTRCTSAGRGPRCSAPGIRVHPASGPFPRLTEPENHHSLPPHDHGPHERYARDASCPCRRLPAVLKPSRCDICDSLQPPSSPGRAAKSPCPAALRGGMDRARRLGHRSGQTGLTGGRPGRQGIRAHWLSGPTRLPGWHRCRTGRAPQTP